MTKIGIFIFAFQLLSLVGTNLLAQQQRITRQEYIEMFKDWAIQDMARSGIPASIKMAQAILESGDGNSRLAREGNNHFGIKCHEWTGERIFHTDDAPNECFRKYENPLHSFEDHTTFLTTRPRYASLFQLEITDYVGWARGLQAAGYATNPRYAELLIRIIEDNQLYLLDQAMGRPIESRAGRPYRVRQQASDLVINPYERREVKYNNGVRFIEVRAGDTFESLTRLFELRGWELPRYNDLPANANISDYSFLYIQAKRRNAHPNHDTHIVAQGQSMHQISQMYGMRLERLYHLNRMEPGTEPTHGQRLNLRRMVKQ